MGSALGEMTVSVWRGAGETGGFEQFSVPRLQSQTVLDVVAWIQQHADPTLAYRYACRVGMCGSCAMMVNGAPRWTCRTHVSRVVGADGTLTVGPLRNLPVIKDLAADMTPFFEKWIAAEGVFHPTRTREDAMVRIDPASAGAVEIANAIECINCGVCHAACDVVAANEKYLGPAALNRAWTLINDARDGGDAVRLDAVSREGGCHNCHSQAGCAQFCPNALNPTASIAGLKRATVRQLFRRGK
jgi:fumarate reductase iron-sulfur subunit